MSVSPNNAIDGRLSLYQLFVTLVFSVVHSRSLHKQISNTKMDFTWSLGFVCVLNSSSVTGLHIWNCNEYILNIHQTIICIHLGNGMSLC